VSLLSRSFQAFIGDRAGETTEIGYFLSLRGFLRNEL
jgi:hypothetical protein